jgi:iron complex transport system substrate-binding protein
MTERGPSHLSWFLRVTALVAALAVATAAPALPAPSALSRRIVSLNLCTDQLLLQLVDPARIASLTYLAADPELSAQAERARGVPWVRATAEEVILLRPDLALAGDYGAPEAVSALRRWGIPVVQFAPAQSWEAIREQLRRAADAVQEVEKGEALLEWMDASLAALEARKPAAMLRAIVVQADGATYGSETLTDAVLRAAGFRNLAAELGIVGYGSISLERILLSDPDLVIVFEYHSDVPTLGRIHLRHPALRGRTLGRVALPAAPFFCGTIDTVRAVQRLVEWRERAGLGAHP